MKQTDGYLDLKSLAAYSSMSESCLRDYIRDGDIPAFKLKGKLLIKRSEFDSWMESNRYVPHWQAKVDEALADLA